MFMKLKNIILIVPIFVLGLNVYAQEEVRGITIEEFIKLACQKDTHFERILIESHLM